MEQGQKPLAVMAIRQLCNCMISFSRKEDCPLLCCAQQQSVTLSMKATAPNMQKTNSRNHSSLSQGISIFATTCVSCQVHMIVELLLLELPTPAAFRVYSLQEGS